MLKLSDNKIEMKKKMDQGLSRGPKRFHESEVGPTNIKLEVICITERFLNRFLNKTIDF